MTIKSFTTICIAAILLSAGNAVAAMGQAVSPSDRVALAYVTSWSEVMPDPNYLTHINYAFGHVTDSFDGVRIDNEDRLREIVRLKDTAPQLKVMLSIGGWGSGRFSEMAAKKKLRASFVKDCKRVVEQFGLDGIDLDWEYPTSSAAGISSSPQDTKNFTLLCRRLRKELGTGKLLTFASSADAKYVDFKAIEPYIDFINIMTYDIDQPPLHHAGLFRSEMTGKLSCEESVMAHHNAGVPMNKLVLGIPFYGKGARGVGGNYRTLINRTDLTEKWDDKAKAPYMVDKEGNIITNHETPRSIAEKCKYLLAVGMRGAMYWEYSQDDNNLTMVKAVYNGVMEKDFQGRVGCQYHPFCSAPAGSSPKGMGRI
ncbi:MAG: glycoside hydrolase family 18 protein [Tannerella sp.]|jgi:chitinase|nr:glycoside hydrolase family 18 protein [Tannerella sp.]